jgi:hypothetical protein
MISASIHITDRQVPAFDAMRQLPPHLAVDGADDPRSRKNLLFTTFFQLLSPSPTALLLLSGFIAAA